MPTAIDTIEKSSKRQGRRDAPATRAMDSAHGFHERGLAAMRDKDHDLAAAHFAHAIQMAGPVSTYCRDLGGALRAAGKFRQAAACYEQAIAGNPGNIRLYVDLARVLIQDNRPAAAVTLLKRALTMEPEAAEAWALLGGALKVSGEPEFAVEALQQAVDLDSGQAAYHFDLGLALCQLGDLERSEAAYKRALQVTSQFPEALNNLGNLLHRRKATAEAVACFRRALEIRPDYADARYNLGLGLQSLDLLEDAQFCYEKVLAENSSQHAASNNCANVLMGLGRVHDALTRYEHAVRLAPSNREYRVNMGMAQLVSGDFREGWRNYASREGPAIAGRRLWNGEHLRGSSILLLSEQGLGDTIQFIRYARNLQLEGARVYLSCPAPLVELLQSATGVERAVADTRPLPSCDWYAPLMHLPGVFGTRVGTIPADVPYLSTDPRRVHHWREWISEVCGSNADLRVGVAWRGGSEHRNDSNRSMSASSLGALKGVPAVTFFSLQKDHPGGCEDLDFVPLPRELRDFADTAALMAHLDLVISVDTSVAHLAGALGRPVWLLLPFAPDWRWMLERDDSPWYPGLRLFRQRERGEWRPVLERIREALTGLSPRALHAARISSFAA